MIHEYFRCNVSGFKWEVRMLNKETYCAVCKEKGASVLFNPMSSKLNEIVDAMRKAVEKM